jgi:hypothetical protein
MHKNALIVNPKTSRDAERTPWQIQTGGLSGEEE